MLRNQGNEAHLNTTLVSVRDVSYVGTNTPEAFKYNPCVGSRYGDNLLYQTEINLNTTLVSVRDIENCTCLRNIVI